MVACCAEVSLFTVDVFEEANGSMAGKLVKGRNESGKFSKLRRRLSGLFGWFG